MHGAHRPTPFPFAVPSACLSVSMQEMQEQHRKQLQEEAQRISKSVRMAPHA